MTSGFNDEGMEIRNTAQAETNFPLLQGITNSATKAGVTGENIPRESLGLLGGYDRVFRQSAGVYGQSGQQGVFGYSTDGSGTGVYGGSKGGSGFGVRGDSTDGIAMQGQSFGNGIAVQGIGGRLAGRFEGDVEVTGDIHLVNADCAEDFDIAGLERVEPGTVMVIDTEGLLRECDRAYDKCVAGVISGAGKYKPAIVLDKQESSKNRMPIALMGKVYCKVDASYGAIEVGDLLTTSSTLGHAMKASDPSQAFGAVIGKALRSLEVGQALIPVLVSLQ
jgi:hypothetical protein